MSQLCGFDLPEDFKTEEYDRIHEHVRNIVIPEPLLSEIWKEYTLGWNAITYRFKAVVYHDEEFRKSLNENTFIGRYIQERELFNFFVNGLSVIETFTYSLYFIGKFIKPDIFNDDYERINPSKTTERFYLGFGKSEVSNYLTRLIEDDILREWKVIRNVLSHRNLPGRNHFLNIGKKENQPPIWQLKELKVDESLTLERRKWLAETLSCGFIETIRFLENL